MSRPGVARGWQYVLLWGGALGSFSCSTIQTQLFAGRVGMADEDQQNIAPLAAHVARIRARKLPSVVVASDGTHLYGLPLDGHPPWQKQVHLVGRPLIAGDLVIGSTHEWLVAWAARTGKEVWRRPSAQWPLVGAADDGRTTVVITRNRGSGSRLLAVARTGAVQRQLESDKRLGAPAIVANIVFLPWHRHYVSAYELTAGEEIGRLTLAPRVSQAWYRRGRLYFGEELFVPLAQFRKRGKRGKRGKRPAPIALPSTGFRFGDTLPFRRALRGVQPADAQFEDYVRTYAAPKAGDAQPGLETGRYYPTYYRLVGSVEQSGSRLQWVRDLRSNAIGGDVYEGGVVVCSKDGHVRVLRASDGSTAAHYQIGANVESCTVQAGQLATCASSHHPVSRAESLRRAVAVADRRLLTARHRVLAQLALDPSQEATEKLLALSKGAPLNTGLARQLAQHLQVRKTGRTALVSAIARPSDFLQNQKPPAALAAIAHALTALRATEAAPHLARYLNDPAVTSSTLREVALALASLARKPQWHQMEQFIRLYRFEGIDPLVQQSVQLIAKALLRIDPLRGRALLSELATDPDTPRAAANGFNQILGAGTISP